MTWLDLYDSLVCLSLLGLVVMAIVWAIFHGPDWYRYKRAAAKQFRLESRVRAMGGEFIPLTPDEIAALRSGQGVFIHQSATGEVLERKIFTPRLVDPSPTPRNSDG